MLIDHALVPVGVDDTPVDVMANRIADRWVPLLSETPIPDIIFKNIDVSTVVAPEVTVVFREMRFKCEEELLHYLCFYDREARASMKFGHEDSRPTGIFVRPPAHQQDEIFSLKSLREQIVKIWPNQFHRNGLCRALKNTRGWHLKMILSANVHTRLRVRSQDRHHNGTRKDMWSLDEFLTKTRDISKETRMDMGVYAYETIVDVPTPESRIILQLYVKTDMMESGDAIPLEEFLKQRQSELSGQHATLPSRASDRDEAIANDRDEAGGKSLCTCQRKRKHTSD
jgi:hypothetical protein